MTSYSRDVAGGGHERAHGMHPADAPLGWWASVRLLGWKGGKVGGLSWRVAVDAYQRGVRGRRRQASLGARIDAELSGAMAPAARLTDPEACPSPPVARSFLLKIVDGGLVISDRRMQQAIGALARFAAEPPLLRQLAAQLPHVDDLYEVAARREGQATIAVVDLEIDAEGKPFDVAVVLLRGDERVAARRWNGVTPELDEWVDGALLCAHNGEAHDAPILRRHGMRLDPPVLDSLRWFWLAAPLEVAHSLRELVDRYGDQAADRAWHTALADAEALAAALPGLRRATQHLPVPTRSGLATALSGSVAPAVLAWMLGQPPAEKSWHHDVVVHSAPRFPPVDADRVVHITRDLSTLTDERAGLIVDGDRARCAARRGGWFLRGGRLIDATALAQSLSGGGWASTIALRLVEEAAGALPMWPPSATDLLYPAGDDGPPAVPVHDKPVVRVGVGPWSCEPDTVALAPEHAPIALIDAVDLLFGGSGPVPGVASHPGPVTAVVTHAGPRRAGTLPQLWAKALGGMPAFVGTAAPIDIEIVLVTGLTRQPNGRRHLARVTGIAAGLSEDRSVVLVTNGERGDMIAGALRGPWRTTTGTHLLRPGTWPTVREAAARLSSSPHLAVATPGVLPRLPVRCPTVIDRIGAPSPEHPLVAQLLTELGEGDPYGDVVEPIAALRLLRVLAATRDRVYVLDPAAESPLVRSSLAAANGWRSVDASAFEGSARSIAARDAILAAAGPEKQTERATLAEVEAAARRLLPEAGRLHDFQRSITTALVDGHDVLGVFRTGAGKSLCYQAAALAMSAAGQGCTLVISPLIALQHDQVAALHNRGVWTATALNSALEPTVRAARLRGIAAGFYQLVYLAPEALFSTGVVATLARTGVALVAVDEAHCITEMGHNFRPEYRSIPAALRRLVGLSADEDFATATDRPQLLALTGTASPEVRADVRDQLQGRFETFVDSQFLRPELHFEVHRVRDEPRSLTEPALARRPVRWAALLDVLAGCQLPGIVYTTSRRDTDELADALQRHGYPRVRAYHAGLPDEQRRTIEAAFRDGDADLVVATSAFGMGIDKDDIRTVIHWRMPPSPEALYQEAGRAGRGPAGQPARCVVLFHPSDIANAGLLVRRGVPTRTELERVWATLGELADLQDPDDGWHVIVSDADLAMLSALPTDMEPHVCLAHLERVGMVVETERSVATVIAQRLADPPPEEALPPVEQKILESLDLWAGRLDVRAVVDALAAEGVTVTLADVSTALRGLQRERRIEVVPPTLQVRPLVDEPVEVLRRRSQRCLRMLDSLGAGDATAWHAPAVSPWLPEAALLMCLEVLAALGAIDVKHEPGRAVPLVRVHKPDVRAARAMLTTAAEVLAAALRHWHPERREVEVTLVAADVRVKEADVRTALMVAHLFHTVLLDPRSWQTGADRAARFSLSRGSTRSLQLDRTDPAAALALAEQRSIALAHRDLLRLDALHTYGTTLAEQVETSEEGGDPYQRYLEDYFTRPGFLEDLAAGKRGALLDGLDEDQAAAVTEEAPRLAIRAGAGSGKTRTITRRVAHRLAAGSLLPEQALAVCFNRAAADEMSVRLAALGIAGVRVATLNSVGNRIVNQHWPSLGFENQPHLMASDPERMPILREIIAEVCPGVAPRQWAQRIIKAIDLARARSIAPADYAEVAEPLRALGQSAPPSPTQVEAVYSAYLEAFRQRGVIDFLGQIELSIDAMSTVDDVRLAVTSSLREILVDEAQDLTALDWRLVELLASGGRLTAVGDPRQAIYEWRGADPGQFTSFCDQSALRDLRYNYRSSAEIVAVANQAMLSYPSLIPVTQEPGTVDERTVAEPIAPAVVEVLRHWLADGIPDDEIAVLVRKGDEIGPILSAASGAGIACRGIDVLKLTSSPAYAAAVELLAEYKPNEDSEHQSELSWSWAQVMRDLVARDDVQEQLADIAEPDQDPITDWHRLLDAVAELEADGPLNLREIDRRLRHRDRSAIPPNGVTVSTIHKAKGMEWTAVVVIDHHDPRSARGREEKRLFGSARGAVAG